MQLFPSGPGIDVQRELSQQKKRHCLEPYLASNDRRRRRVDRVIVSLCLDCCPLAAAAAAGQSSSSVVQFWLHSNCLRWSSLIGRQWRGIVWKTLLHVQLIPFDWIGIQWITIRIWLCSARPVTVSGPFLGTAINNNGRVIDLQLI